MTSICSFFRLHTTRKTPSTHACVKWWHCRSSRQSRYQTPSTALKRKPPTKTSKTSLTMYIAHGSTTTSSVSSTGLCLWRPSVPTTMSRGGITGSPRVAVRGPVPFYSLLTELYSEAADIPLQLKMVTESKLQRYQRRYTRQIQGKLCTLWYQYCNNTISAIQVIERVCRHLWSTTEVTLLTMNFLCNVCVVFLVRTHHVW